ncbi:glutamate--cysteine ligase [Zymomonas mobilis]|uniref:Glutamate--cysteine ligase n=1 Tax=Zymomonas mobilis subsp. pomaceae (strain ATCC 29192 / DSM 22645 / JCM 10191 / CCUG 17912 / NBRC 13757 / NCIMB 11200 / NRRL B-4491 / Barker I) TaxID=579138 RepID=F8EW32_ZYMMT|nr:glutamate--cysteine ligase [Zymomonas mobilis]AEI38442.1 glutamate/cysteine ligase [Zymomonas mobilis subsp. pomaceae ATCC 29192]MDX5948131.1 glutamate--cysteine ligase [Zymomonas mobilis subsp. pomaceae]GEB89758.1 glutamate--cysteine ligase [Zymomonas mobilis subsp. pomaceae]
MSTRQTPNSQDRPIENREDLLRIFKAGEKPQELWRVGTEHEKFVYKKTDHHAPSYTEEGGIQALLKGLTRFGWKPVCENDTIIGLSGDDGAISLEPAGQFELSGAPRRSIHETHGEITRHIAQINEVSETLGLGFMGLGLWPDKKRSDLSLMPKGRYKIMANYMPKVGHLGLDMMLRTCTIQTNMDYASEADMVKKFRVSLALQPLATAIFANSPFLEGKPDGFLSYRSHIWTDTDPNRTGILPFVFEEGFGYDRYVDYMLSVPMYFVYRDGHYIDAAGQDFRAFLRGELPALPGEKPLVSDWVDHLSTAFPEVRLKGYLEMRGADGGPALMSPALGAFWVGILYDDALLNTAWDIVKSWTLNDHQSLRNHTPKKGLQAVTGDGRTLLELGRQLLPLIEQALIKRNYLNEKGQDESLYLKPIKRILESGQSAAEYLLEMQQKNKFQDLNFLYQQCDWSHPLAW